MGDGVKGSDDKSSNGNATYEEARDMLERRDFDNLLKLASDETSFPEMLYYLSTDDDPEIRTKVASNPTTPIQADEALSRDAEPLVRQAVGKKVARTLPTLDENQNSQQSAAVAILEHLIEDEEVRVRRIIAEELKSTDKAPLHIIQKLARDIDELVSSPVLKHSPILDDEELISIIESSADTPQLKAISDRRVVSEPLAECIVETADVEAISQLLLNPSAQIRENTLDQLIAGAREVPEWHEPLVLRPKLPFGAVRKIADFVAGSLLEVLSERNDIDDDLRDDLEKRVLKRLGEEKSTEDTPDDSDNKEIERKLRRLDASGDLDESFVKECVDAGDRIRAILSLAIMADIPTIITRRIFVSQSAKAMMSLCWKAGISASLSTKFQSSLGNIPTANWILPNSDDNFPFTPREMQWQLELFLEQEAVA